MENNPFRLLRADEIDVRMGSTGESKNGQWSLFLLYKDARADMIVLDETVGAENWSRKHYVLDGVIYCSVGVRLPIYEDASKKVIKGFTDWTYKDDCGTESRTEQHKGASSDAFKRACTNWGLGRELYTSPRIVLFEPTAVSSGRSLYVASITYDGSRNIKTVVLKDYRHPDFVKECSNR